MVASEGVDANPLSAGGREVKFGKGLGDPLGWVRSLMDWIRDERKWHPIQRPDSTAAAPLASEAKIALLSDWGNGMSGAPVSANSIAQTGGSDLLMHLGDIYYSGTTE